MRTSAGDDEPVAPAIQLDLASPLLLRRVSGAPETGPVAMLGCGSVGSKMAMHLARSGIRIPVVSDRDLLLPHNMARHALARSAIPDSKAAELAGELAHLGQSPKIHKGDLVVDLTTREGRRAVLPKQAAYAVNATAMLDPDAIATACLAAFDQPRSTWSWEIELRPWVETF